MQKELRTVDGRLAAALLGITIMVSACSSDESSAGRQRSDTDAPAAAPLNQGAGRVFGKAATISGESTIVVLTPQGSHDVPPPDASATMDQVQMMFVPNILFARSGYPVTFHSSDEELHNVNARDSETRQQEFNVAITPDGTYQHIFKRPGFYDVHCDVHPAMSAQIVVTDTPFAAAADRQGRFVFEGVPPGSYSLSVYAGARRLERLVQVSGGSTEVQAE